MQVVRFVKGIKHRINWLFRDAVVLLIQALWLMFCLFAWIASKIIPDRR